MICLLVSCSSKRIQEMPELAVLGDILAGRLQWLCFGGLNSLSIEYEVPTNEQNNTSNGLSKSVLR